MEDQPCLGVEESQIDAFHGLTNSAESIGTIPSYISIKKGEYTYTLKLEAPSGFEIVELEVYPSTEIQNLPKEKWWTKAKTRSIFTIPSPVDPLKMKLDQLLVASAKSMAEKKSKARKEDELLVWLREHPSSPILGVGTDFKCFFFNSKFVLWNMTKFRNRKIFEILAKEICVKSVQKIAAYQSNLSPIYHAINDETGEMYYNESNSLYAVNELLQFQFNRNNEHICPFIIIKNYFFDMVIHFFFLIMVRFTISINMFNFLYKKL